MDAPEVLETNQVNTLYRRALCGLVALSLTAGIAYPVLAHNGHNHGAPSVQGPPAPPPSLPERPDADMIAEYRATFEKCSQLEKSLRAKGFDIIVSYSNDSWSSAPGCAPGAAILISKTIPF